MGKPALRLVDVANDFAARTEAFTRDLQPESLPPDTYGQPAEDPSMPAEPTVNWKDYVDLKAEVTKAQNDSRFDDVLAQLRTMRETSVTTRQLWAAVFTGAATVLGVMLAALSFGADRFDGGVGFSTQVQDQLARDAAQDERIDAVLDRLDAVIDRLPAPTPDQP